MLYWLGWQDSNLRMSESKSDALPLGYSPKWCGRRDSNPRSSVPQTDALTSYATTTMYLYILHIFKLFVNYFNKK